MFIFCKLVLTFVGVVQSSRLAEINQHLIFGFRFFDFEKKMKKNKKKTIEQAMRHQPSLWVPRAGTWLTVHRPLQVDFYTFFNVFNVFVKVLQRILGDNEKGTQK